MQSPRYQKYVQYCKFFRSEDYQGIHDMNQVAQETKFEKSTVLAEYKKDFKLSEEIVKMKPARVKD